MDPLQKETFCTKLPALQYHKQKVGSPYLMSALLAFFKTGTSDNQQQTKIRHETKTLKKYHLPEKRVLKKIKQWKKGKKKKQLKILRQENEEKMNFTADIKIT